MPVSPLPPPFPFGLCNFSLSLPPLSLLVLFFGIAFPPLLLCRPSFSPPCRYPPPPPFSCASFLGWAWLWIGLSMLDLPSFVYFTSMRAPPPCSLDLFVSIPPFASFFGQLTNCSLFCFVIFFFFSSLSSFPCFACNFPYFLVCLLFVIIYLLVLAHFVGAALGGFTQTIPSIF
jgi:hypothetical protein